MNDSLGNTSGPTVGAEIGPQGFQQDMWAIDTIAGSNPAAGRDLAPGTFTGGTGGGGLGGQAEPMEPGGTVYERRGF